jgi:hypothetical protein
MRYLRYFVLCVLAAVLSACNTNTQLMTENTLENQAVTKKLIDLSGYNVPYPDTLLATIPAMKTRGYAGSIFKLKGLWSDVFVKTPEHRYNQTAFTSNYPTLRQLKASGYTQNFLIIYSQMEEGWSWLSNTDWSYAEAKLGGFAKAAKEGGLPGIMFDSEPYGFSPWRYDQAYYGGKTLAQVSQVVRERGKRFIQILQTEVPNAKILSLWLMYPILNQWPNYELLKPFFEGMLEAALPTVQFIDGNEVSYYFLTAQEFDASKLELQGAYTALNPALTSKYKNQLKVANAVYVDGVLNLWRSPRFFGYYLLSDSERLRLIQHNTYHGLRSSDEYVWVYNENMNYYGDKIPAGLVNNLKAGQNKQKTAQPLGFSVTTFVNRAKLEFDRKINVSGNIKTSVQNSGVDILSGFVDEYGDESACVVYDAYGNYDCIFPFGTSVTLKPILSGATFTPSQRSFSNLTQTLGDQNFTQR